jgi:hypothetical protein
MIGDMGVLSARDGAPRCASGDPNVALVPYLWAKQRLIMLIYRLPLSVASSTSVRERFCKIDPRCCANFFKKRLIQVYRR